MGVNAQTTVPKFTAGQVLTAAQQTAINTGIPVFATTTTRDDAFGGTGEKVLAEGQFAYIEANNATQYYDGAAWQTVGGGLTLITAQTIGSAVSSVTVNNVFSSTYDNYRIVIIGGVASADVAFNMTLGATATGYYYGGMYSRFDNGGTGALVGNNSTQWRIGSVSTNNLSATVDLIGPNLAKVTSYSTLANDTTTTAGNAGSFICGFQNSTTQFTGFTVAPSSGTLTGGTIRVYGYQNS